MPVDRLRLHAYTCSSPHAMKCSASRYRAPSSTTCPNSTRLRSAGQNTLLVVDRLDLEASSSIDRDRLASATARSSEGLPGGTERVRVSEYGGRH